MNVMSFMESKDFARSIDSIVNGLDLALYVLMSICNMVVFAIMPSVFVNLYMVKGNCVFQRCNEYLIQ